MPRPTPPDRLSKLLDAAAVAFVEHGFHRTQMDDIAERLGVSKGTIYRSVQSKDALFAAVIAWADTPDTIPGTGPDTGLDTGRDVAAVAGELTGELARAVAGLELATIVADRTPLTSNAPAHIARRTAIDTGHSAAFGDEVERITVELHQLMRAHRTAIMVLDRCAAEIPELAAVWFGHGRYALVDLWQHYLSLRAEHITTGVDIAVLARTIVEVITTWAVKMPWDPAPRPYPADTADDCGVMIRRLVAGAHT